MYSFAQYILRYIDFLLHSVSNYISAKTHFFSKIYLYFCVLLGAFCFIFCASALQVDERVIYKGFKSDIYKIKAFHNSIVEFDDSIMLVIGPQSSSIVWKKDKEFGMWVNAESHFIPYHYSVIHLYTTGDMDEITSDYNIKLLNLERFDEGDENELYQVFLGWQFINDFYRKQESGLITEDNTIIGDIELPIQAPVGIYKIYLYLFKEKKLIYAAQTEFSVKNNTLFYRLNRAAKRYPIIYSLSAILIALLFGWKAAFFFRKKGNRII